MYLPDRSVLSSLGGRRTDQLWDHKDFLHSHRQTDSFLHSSQLCKLATDNKKIKIIKTMKNEKQS